MNSYSKVYVHKNKVKVYEQLFQSYFDSHNKKMATTKYFNSS